MKKLLSLAAAAAFALVSTHAFAAGCSDGDGCCAPEKASAPAKPGKAAAQTYTCPMHPKVTSDKPGKCPECGMDLVLKKTDEKTKK